MSCAKQFLGEQAGRVALAGTLPECQFLSLWRCAQNSLPCCIKRCSTIGLSESAGKNVSAPTMTTVPISKPTNNGPCVGRVPLVTASCFLAARFPATANIGIMMRNRPASIVMPSVRLYQGVFALMPANALPLLAAELEYAYKISENPCGPLLFKLEVAGPLDPFQ